MLGYLGAASGVLVLILLIWRLVFRAREIQGQALRDYEEAKARGDSTWGFFPNAIARESYVWLLRILGTALLVTSLMALYVLISSKVG